jgi:organic radical activating enzyme
VCPLVTITGGEPLLQKTALEEFCRELWYEGYHISIETNGSICIPKNWRVSWVVDYKLPFSAMHEHMISPEKQWSRLHASDFIKFVVYGGDDLKMALNLMKTVETKATFAISPVIGMDNAVSVLDIVKEVIESGILKKKKVILNHQLHKTLNLREPH